MIPYNFHVGQKVICIDDRYSNPQTMQHFKQWVERDKEYTIRKVRPQGAEGGVLLEEVVNPPCFFPQYGGKLEPAFHPKRFVPKEEMEGDEVIMEAAQILREKEIAN